MLTALRMARMLRRHQAGVRNRCDTRFSVQWTANMLTPGPTAARPRAMAGGEIASHQPLHCALGRVPQRPVLHPHLADAIERGAPVAMQEPCPRHLP